MMSACWKSEAEKRINFCEILEILKNYVSADFLNKSHYFHELK